MMTNNRSTYSFRLNLGRTLEISRGKKSSTVSHQGRHHTWKEQGVILGCFFRWSLVLVDFQNKRKITQRKLIQVKVKIITKSKKVHISVQKPSQRMKEYLWIIEFHFLSLIRNLCLINQKKGGRKSHSGTNVIRYGFNY